MQSFKDQIEDDSDIEEDIYLFKIERCEKPGDELHTTQEIGASTGIRIY
jgi:hypothetical protein